jgi:ABC-type nitrate/sulfonate/bicarbonate transport system substrate-binding protein
MRLYPMTKLDPQGNAGRVREQLLRRKRPMRHLLSGSLAVVVGISLAAVGDATPSSAASHATKLTTVTVAQGPYYDYQLLTVAHMLGLDHQLGLNFKIEPFPNPALSALQTGRVDVTYACDSCYFATAKSFPTYRNFIVTDLFKGFALIGRKGKVTPYSVYVNRYHGNLAAAKRAFVLQQVKGKTISICPITCGNLSPFEGLLAQAGLTVNDVHIVKFATDGEAADAFLAGTGNFYTGALPQEARLLYSPEFHGEFIDAAPQQAFGPGVEGGASYSTFATSEQWLKANPTVAKKVVAVWYRAVQYLHKDPSKILPMIAQLMKVAVGGVFPASVTKDAVTELEYFPTFNQAKTYVFGANSPTNQIAAAEYQAKSAGVVKQLPGGVATYEVSQKYYDEVAADTALVSYINAPVPQ